MTRAAHPSSPAPLGDYEPEIHDLAHIALLLRVVTDESGLIPPDLAGALSFLACLASDRVEILRRALSGVQS